MHPCVLSGLNWEGKKLIISSYGSQKGIENAAIKDGCAAECIVKLYDEVSSLLMIKAKDIYSGLRQRFENKKECIRSRAITVST